MALVTLSGVRKTFRRGRSRVHAVNGVDLHIEPGETLALIGESGSGKSTVGRLALGLLQPDEGTVVVDGRRLDQLDRKALQAARRNMTIVFQEPFQSLDPLMSVGRIIEEPLVIHEPSLTPPERRERVEDTMRRVILDPGLYERRPRELSGGQQQRVGVARAIVTGPKFVVLDEPTSSLDLSVQAGILDLLANLQQELDLAYLFISHDIGTVDFFFRPGRCHVPRRGRGDRPEGGRAGHATASLHRSPAVGGAVRRPHRTAAPHRADRRHPQPHRATGGLLLLQPLQLPRRPPLRHREPTAAPSSPRPLDSHLLQRGRHRARMRGTAPDRAGTAALNAGRRTDSPGATRQQETGRRVALPGISSTVTRPE